MLDPYLEKSVRAAFGMAQQDKHEYVTPEHLLLTLLDNESALDVFEACCVNIKELQGDLICYLRERIPTSENVKDIKEVEPTLPFQRILQQAFAYAQSTGRRQVTGADVVAAIFEEPQSYATYLLLRQNLERVDVVNYIMENPANGPDSDIGESDRIVRVDEERSRHSHRKQHRKPPFLDNLNEKARKGLFDPLIGRERELDRAIHILCRRRKNNPLFIGDAGVGKTAIVEGLADKIVGGNVPEVIRDKTIYSLNIGGLLAGTRYRGDFEQRLKQVIDMLVGEKTAILFIDEIHTIIGAGSASGSTTDVSNLLKPVLSTGAFKCIGSTTIQEYRSVFEKDSALSRRFQKVDIKEPGIRDTYKILVGVKERFEEYHGVAYSNKILHAVSELSARHLNDRSMPDKAIDVIDEVGAAIRVRGHSGKAKKHTVRMRDIEKTISTMAQIPPRHVSKSRSNILMGLEYNLKRVLFGQDHAIDKVVTAIKLAQSGLSEEARPSGCFLFSGPTGVGKTELAKQLALHLNIPLLRYDMSEYMERHSVSRLIGAPPGYVGYTEGGLLANDVMQSPYSVVLLDEIEKAHPDIYNVLLQVMDYGTITDTNGRKVDFGNVVLIMTTNAGAVEIEKGGLGFMPGSAKDQGADEIKRVFSPEFRNRLDAMVSFNALDEQTILRVTDKLLVELSEQLAGKRIILKVGKAMKAWLAENGYDKAMGVRPMRRLIVEKMKKPILDAVLFGELKKGGVVTWTVKNKKPKFTCSELKTRRKVTKVTHQVAN